ncbi:MAG: alpha/beta hydrolase [Roseburia sp.]|nr:alpha/beta hydrolase [Roseburia sp.]
MMKYEIDNDLTKIARQKAPSNIYLYAIVNMVMKLSKCKSDDKVVVNKYVTPRYENGKLSTFVIEPRKYSGILPCIIFYHGGGFLLKASNAHCQIAKWYAEMAKYKVVFTDYRLLPKNKYPVTDRRMITESMKKFTDTPVWDAKLTAMFWKAYLGNQVPKQIQYASPIEAESLEHFPNVYIEVAEFDSLRDEGIAFAERLRSEGVLQSFMK